MCKNRCKVCSSGWLYLQSFTRRRASTMDTPGAGLFEASVSRHVIPPLFHSLSVGSPGSGVGIGLGSAPSTPLSAALSPRSLALYSSEDTVESVIGRLLLLIFY